MPLEADIREKCDALVITNEEQTKLTSTQLSQFQSIKQNLVLATRDPRDEDAIKLSLEQLAHLSARSGQISDEFKKNIEELATITGKKDNIKSLVRIYENNVKFEAKFPSNAPPKPEPKKEQSKEEIKAQVNRESHTYKHKPELTDKQKLQALLYTKHDKQLWERLIAFKFNVISSLKKLTSGKLNEQQIRTEKSTIEVNLKLATTYLEALADKIPGIKQNGEFQRQVDEVMSKNREYRQVKDTVVPVAQAVDRPAPPQTRRFTA